MNKQTFVHGKDGNVIGKKTVDEQTQVTTVRDRHGNVGVMAARNGTRRAEPMETCSAVIATPAS